MDSILDAEIHSCFYNVTDISCNGFLSWGLIVLVLHIKKDETLYDKLLSS